MTTGRHIERAPNRIGSELTTAEMSLGALSCEYVMDVWRVWHVFLLEPPVAAAGSSLEPSAAHMLLIACRRRTQTSSAARGRLAGNGGAIIIGPLAAGGSLRLAAVGGRAAKRTRWWIRLSARATFCGSDRPTGRMHAAAARAAAHGRQAIRWRRRHACMSSSYVIRNSYIVIRKDGGGSIIICCCCCWMGLGCMQNMSLGWGDWGLLGATHTLQHTT